MPAAICIESLTEKDLDTVLDIESSSFTSPWSCRAVREELASSSALCYTAKLKNSTQKNKIAGYLFFRLVADEMHIMKIAVSRDFRRKKIASRLMSEGIETARAKGAVSAFLETGASNSAAVEFYKKHDFKVIGIRKNYYSKTGDDALNMMKNLKEE